MGRVSLHFPVLLRFSEEDRRSACDNDRCADGQGGTVILVASFSHGHSPAGGTSKQTQAPPTRSGPNVEPCGRWEQQPAGDWFATFSNKSHALVPHCEDRTSAFAQT